MCGNAEAAAARKVAAERLKQACQDRFCEEEMQTVHRMPSEMPADIWALLAKL